MDWLGVMTRFFGSKEKGYIANEYFQQKDDKQIFNRMLLSNLNRDMLNHFVLISFSALWSDRQTCSHN